MHKFLIVIATIFVIASSCKMDDADEGVRLQPDYNYDNDSGTELESIKFNSAGEPIATGTNISVISYYDSVMSYATYFFDGTLFSSNSPLSYDTTESRSIAYIASYPTIESLNYIFEYTVSSDQSLSTSYASSNMLVAYVEPTTSLTPTLDFEQVMSTIAITVKVSDSTGADISDAISNLRFNLLSTIQCDIDNNSYSALSGESTSITPFRSDNSYKVAAPAQYIEAKSGFATMQIEGQTFSIKNDAMQLLAGKNYELEWLVNTETKEQVVNVIEGVIEPWEDGLSDDTPATSHGSVTINPTSFGEDLSNNDLLPKELTIDAISIVSSGVGTYFNGYIYYSNGTITFESSAYPITSIKFSGSINATVDSGEFSDNYEWSGNSKKVTFTIVIDATPTMITQIEVTF